MSVGTWLIAHDSQIRYFEESSQIQSQPVAMYMANQAPLFVGGKPDAQALQDLARHVMMINPSLEVYLLDNTGQVIATALGDTSVLQRRVDMRPLHHFLQPKAQMPIYGDNPRRAGERRVFSVFPVGDSSRENSGCNPCGYVYVVLGGSNSESIWKSLLTRYSVQNSTVLLIAVLGVALMIGITLFFMLTRPLRRLAETMSQLQLPVDKSLANSAREVLDSSPFGTQRDANELKALENAYQQMSERLRGQYEALNRADERRRDFMTRVSHDLRTPLTSLCGALETVVEKRGTLTVRQEKDYLRLAQRQGYRLQHLISQVFELARLDSGDVDLHLEPVHLLELLTDTVQDLNIQAQEQGVRLLLDFDEPAKRVVVSADMALLHRVFENLLSNAIKHSSEAGSVTVGIRLKQPGRVHLVVVDTGCGFSNSLRQVPLKVVCSSWPQSRGTAQGTGLGLGIVDGILALHGSVAYVWSEPRIGARIEFSLAMVTPTSHSTGVSELITDSCAVR